MASTPFQADFQEPLLYIHTWMARTTQLSPDMAILILLISLIYTHSHLQPQACLPLQSIILELRLHHRTQTGQVSFHCQHLVWHLGSPKT